MANRAKAPRVEDMLPEYDFSGGDRGKYLARYHSGTNVVLLDPDIADAFPDAASVNRTLRLLVNVARRQVSGSQSSKGRKRGEARSTVKPQKRARTRTSSAR
jgi:hypothetical protein